MSPTLLEKNSYSLSIPRYVDPIIDIMKSEDLVNLLDYVDVYYPDTSKACTATTFRSKNMKYPIDYENMEMDEGSDVAIHEGDIVFELINKHRAFYINKEPINRVVLPSSPYVCLLRLKSGILSISPKYICMYLNSQTIKKIMNVYADSIFAQRLRRQDIEKLKIIRPKLEASYYSTLFDYQISPHNQNQEPIDIINKQAKDTNIESIFIIEQIQKLWGNRQNELQEIFNSDLAEVQNCIRVKAYKSALIMCGAILEAFLIDWLNEKDPKGDWLSEHENDKTGKYNLCNYINQIKEIQKPHWIDPAQKAHVIRKKRNLVHATLCLNKEQTIDENLCLKVLQYLKYVISTRWN